MTSGQQRSKTSALIEKEATVNSVANDKEYAGFLGAIPTFSNTAMEVLEEFVVHGEFKVPHPAGEALCSPTECDQNLYVLVSGSATLDAGDGVQIRLQPGDYFGRNPRHHDVIASVTADVDSEVLVLQPQEFQLLERASSRHRHPSLIEWRSALTTPATPLPRQYQRTLVAS
jgi:Cyclic nucleotide-binding domain